MKRILLLLAVALVMAAMIAASAMPAFAIGRAKCGIGTGESTFAAGSKDNQLGQGTAATARSAIEQGSNEGAFVSDLADECAQG